MTSSGGAVPQDLAARLFRALYDDYDLHTIGDIHVAVPKRCTLLRRSHPERDRPPGQRLPPGRPEPAARRAQLIPSALYDASAVQFPAPRPGPRFARH